MGEIWSFIETLLNQIHDIPVLAFLLAALADIGLTQALKLPVKKLTNKIANNVVRQKVNLVIMLFPFGIGILVLYLLSLINGLNIAFDWQVGMAIGYVAEFVYSVVEKLFAKIKNDEVINDEVIAEIAGEAKEEADDKKDSFAELLDKVNLED